MDNKEREVIRTMIRTDDLFDEIKAIDEIIKNEKSLTVFEKAQLKALTLNLKLLHNLRTNSVMIMQKLGIEKVKSRTSGTSTPAQE